MAQQIKKKFLAPEVIDYFDNQISSVEQSVEAESGRIDQEILDRVQGDSDSLQAAKDYTDAEVLEEKGLREAADTALDGRITSLEGQVGEDLQQAISDLEADIAAEALARANADTALQGQIDVLKTFGLDQVIHVAKNGLDTNSGKQHSPFLTITAALNAISDASPTKRYALKVAPGNYSEAISLKANVFIVGEGQKESVRVTGAVSMHSSFSGTGDHRSGFSNVTLLTAADFNWATVTSGAGKLYFNETVFASTVNMYGHNNAIAQAQFNACILFGNLTVSGINLGVFTNNVCYANINLNQHPNGGMATIFVATGGYCQGTITQTASVNDFNRRSASFLRHFNCEQLVLNGPSVYADVDLVSQGKQLPSISNSASLIALNPTINHDLTSQMIVPKATNAHNMGDWGKQWSWNFGYVHASTGTDLYLISYPESYAPDSSGKSIGIYTDGAGLQENVNGGSIELATASVTGTGVRGKIILDAKEIDVTSKQVKNLADGTLSTDAVNKGQLDAAIAAIPEVDLSGYYTKTEIDTKETALDSKITTEKERIDAILLAADADKDSFAEIVSLINSVDIENDTAFAGYVTSNNARVDALEAKGYSKGSVVVGAELGFVDLDRVYSVLLSVSVGRLAVHEGEDYTTSIVAGKTRLTWIGSLVNPGGSEAIETGDKVFYSGAF
jgi:pectin methylesterase-like acyl-CoA thioesterase